MRRLGIGNGALAGALLTAPLIALSYLGDSLAGLPFLPFDLFDWITRVLPGTLVTFGIDVMIDAMRLAGVSVASAAKTAEQGIAVAQFFVMGLVAGALFFATLKWRGHRPDMIVGLVVGGLVGLPIIAISIAIGGSDVQPVLVIAWVAALFLAWGQGLIQAYVHLNVAESQIEVPQAADTGQSTIDRRRFLIRLGAASATITVAASGFGNLLAQAARRELEAELAASMAHQTRTSLEPPFPNANDPLMSAPGTRPEYTPLKDHYKVFIRTEPTTIDGATWSLPIVGLVDNPLTLTIDDLRKKYTPRKQYVTISCISGRIGTDLISTTQWTGASVQEILADLRPTDAARYLKITSGDGFYETVDLDLIASDERIMLCYAWDGGPLPFDHGFPLRIWLPDRYGMKQPKWITGVEVSSDYKEGYWVERGWDEVARVKATSVIDTVAAGAAYESAGRQLIPVGGIAFAGARGISRVEIRVDGGPWREAQLRAPLSETTWVIWRYDWPFESGDHKFEVRCAEGNGTPQIEIVQSNRPSGASGIHGKKARL